MDLKEKEMLEVLQNNSKITVEQLATMLGMDKDAIANQIKELEEKKVIVKYHTLINWEKTDEEMVQALIEVNVTPKRGAGFDTVAERIYRFPEVRSVYLMSGRYDITVIVEGKTMKEVALFVATKLATLEDVQSTATHFVLKKYKQEGIILDDDNEDKRLVISP